MKKILLVLLLWIRQGYTDCPDSCNCTSRSVMCINQELETVPILDNLEISPIILDFSGNKLLLITQEDFNFTKCDEVKEVYLNNSEIADIGFATFNELENLQELYLGQNYLSSISENIIEELDSMILLDISNNYFNGDMPVIRSKSLEVLVLANSKISHIPHKSLKHLTNLKVLLLQQNNIQTLATNIFDQYVSNSLFIKFSYNSWQCNCENIRTFEVLDHKNFIDPLEPYQCSFEGKELVNIFGANGAIEIMSQECNSNNNLNNELSSSIDGYHEVRDMVDEDRRGLRNLDVNKETATPGDIEYDEEYDDKELDIKEMNDKDLGTVLPGGCFERFSNRSPIESLFMVILIATVSSFFMGFASGLVFCKVLYSFRYKKLEQSSDSQVQLLRP